MANVDRQRSGELPLWAGAAILAISAVAFLIEQRSFAAVNGWWNDELYSMFCTNPALRFFYAYGARFRWDPTPPLYYSALFWVRRFVPVTAGHERLWNYIVSFLAIALASAAVGKASGRIGLTGFALAGVGAFLLSGPVLEYVPEVRAYLMAMTIVFAAAWLAALTIEEPSLNLHRNYWIVLGALAALTHVYSALMCGLLAASLVLLAIFAGRRELKAPGLTLGMSVSIVYVIWAVTTPEPKMWLKDHWIVFTRDGTRYAAEENLYLEIGGYLALSLLVALLACAIARRPTRHLAAAFFTAIATFYVLPILISFKAPIVYDRYWMIGGPVLVVLMVFLARAGLSEGFRSRPRAVPLALGTGAVVFLLSSSTTGFTHALVRIKSKKTWKQSETVAALARSCPAGSIRVVGYPDGYAMLSRLPADRFVGFEKPASKIPAEDTCPVLGWGEDLYIYGLKSGTDEDMLRFIRIDALPSEVAIHRIGESYIVLRRNVEIPASR